MEFEGGCYCGAIRYRAEGAPAMRAQCHCRECQYITGGGPNYFVMMPAEHFAYTGDTPRPFARTDLDRPVTREFCPTCGTHLATRMDGFPSVVVKVGTMDDPSRFGGPDLALFTCDMQTFHEIPDKLPRFERMPR